jgi:hypothetical protein
MSETLEDLDSSSLAGTVWAKEGEDLSGEDVEVDTCHGLQAAVFHPEAPYTDYRGTRGEGRVEKTR